MHGTILQVRVCAGPKRSAETLTALVSETQTTRSMITASIPKPKVGRKSNSENVGVK